MPTFRAKLLSLSLLAFALFIVGWALGSMASQTTAAPFINRTWSAIKQATVDSYVNRYRVMSDSGLESIVYYVSTKNRQALDTAAEQSADIIDVAETPIDNLYDVRISYASRVPTVKSLRAMTQIDAVITVPLFCH